MESVGRKRNKEKETKEEKEGEKEREGGRTALSSSDLRRSNGRSSSGHELKSV